MVCLWYVVSYGWVASGGINPRTFCGRRGEKGDWKKATDVIWPVSFFTLVLTECISGSVSVSVSVPYLRTYHTIPYHTVTPKTAKMPVSRSCRVRLFRLPDLVWCRIGCIAGELSLRVRVRVRFGLGLYARFDTFEPCVDSSSIES